jgi:Sec-independent protein secretion pathway component TatC
LSELGFTIDISKKSSSQLMDSRSPVEAQVRPFGTLRAPFLSLFAILSLLAAPNPVAALAPGGGYVPVVSLFLDGIRNGILPTRWRIIAFGPNEQVEIYAVASVALALLLSSPIIAYQLMKVIASVRGTRRMLYPLTAAASLLLASGALFGYVFSCYVFFAVLTPCSVDLCMVPTVIDAGYFYLISLGTIATVAVVFTAPAYIYALVRFRR